MLSASRALGGNGSAGDWLPDVFPLLAEEGIHFRRTQMSMIVAGPGVGKSNFALIASARMGVRTLYMSADTDAHTTNTRLVSAVLDVSQDDVRLDDPVSSEALEALASLQFSFDASPSIDDIVGEVDAYAMLYGEYPELIIVDNLKNLYSDADNEFTAYANVLDELHQLARLTTAHVMVLHHAVGEYENGNTPIPLSGLNGKVGKIPELVLTLYRIHDSFTDSLGICPVKHRNGTADASGRTAIFHAIDYSRMFIGAPLAQKWGS